MTGKKYKKSPITEALIDIKVDPVMPRSKIDNIRTFHDQIKDYFPKSKDRRMFEAKLSFQKDGGTNTEHVDHGVDGVQFWSADEKEVVQYRLDGYTFSRLQPYQSWEEHFPIAIKYWKKYLDTLRPMAVKRIAVRYINQIDIPQTRVNLEEYLENSPSPAKGLPQDLDQFLTRLIINNGDGVKAGITQTMQPSPSLNSIRVLLDIDVFLDLSIQSNKTGEIQEKLENMHLFAEEIFEKTLTNKTKELFD